MEKVIKRLIFSLFIMFTCVGVSMADGDLPNVKKECDYGTQAELQSEAKNISVTYEDSIQKEYEGYDPYTEKEGYDEKRYINLKIYNIGPNLLLTIDNETTGKRVTVSNGVDYFTYVNAKDGVITVKRGASYQIVNYTIKIYGLTSCKKTVLRTIRYTLPAINPYSDFEICQDVPEFYLCQPLITTPIASDIDVPAAVNRYKEQLAEKGLREEEQANNTPKISKIISDTSKKKIGFVIVLLTIGVGITLFILYRRKKGAK
ncbi:MAG: hypothetical protein IKQ29_00455 [Bacilli bacterium]|nr:hypothetical protein [Bacilli bacterium]